MPDSFIDDLTALLGKDAVLVRSLSGDLSAYENDYRGRSYGVARAVVLPKTTNEVTSVVRYCYHHAIPMVPQGGNTGLVVGGTPNDRGQEIVISLSRMNRIIGVDTDNGSITVEAGALLQSVQEAASAVGLIFPLSMASEGSCTIGGNLSTNAGGVAVLRYGNVRDLCLGLEVVTPTGEVFSKLSALRKDNTGYSLKDIFIGAEGTLGIITQAVLKLYPMPKSVNTAWLLCKNLSAVINTFTFVRAQLGAELTSFEMMSEVALNIATKHFPNNPLPLSIHRGEYAVLLEVSSMDEMSSAHHGLMRVLEACIDKGVVENGVVASGLAQSQNLWAIRENIPSAQAREGLNIKHDIALPISRIVDFVSTVEPILQAHCQGIRVVNFGHIGDGNLHFNIQAPLGINPAAFLEKEEGVINDIVYRAVTQHGGTISAEHGIGTLKRQWLSATQSPTAIALMQSLKRAWDPNNIMNPQRVISI